MNFSKKDDSVSKPLKKGVKRTRTNKENSEKAVLAAQDSNRQTVIDVSCDVSLSPDLSEVRFVAVSSFVIGECRLKRVTVI